MDDVKHIAHWPVPYKRSNRLLLLPALAIFTRTMMIMMMIRTVILNFECPLLSLDPILRSFPIILLMMMIIYPNMLYLPLIESFVFSLHHKVISYLFIILIVESH